MTPLDPETESPHPASAAEQNAGRAYTFRGTGRSGGPRSGSLLLALALFLLTLLTCLAAGGQFAASYARNETASFDEFVRALKLLVRHPSGLGGGLPFALTLMGILLAHELGHWFACRKHGIRASYPFFIPAPTLIGTLGAFILIRSPIRSRRALFDVGASGPIVGFCLALPALAYGILHGKVVPRLDAGSEFVFGIPLALRVMAALLRPGVAVTHLLLHPVGRAAWVGLFATALNLLPSGQLDGGHILRTLNDRWHARITQFLPLCLIPLGYFLWPGWYIWAGLLFGLSFFRSAPMLDATPLDPRRRVLALLSFFIFLACFMPEPV